MTVGSAEQLFSKYFLPLYPPELAADLARVRSADANPANNASILAQLDETAGIFARLGPSLLGPEPIELDFSDASVHLLASRLTRARRDAWLTTEKDGREPPAIVRLVTHGAVYVGSCAVRHHGARWLVRRPLWESLVSVESPLGVAEVSMLSWWLRSLSDDEIDAPRLADRWRTHVEIPTFDPTSLPVFVQGAATRRIPPLAKVRYDTLHKHLRAHVPELRTVGDDFPTPERLDELALRSLDFTLLGDGRLLLVHGLGREGLHLFWLGPDGFRQAAFFPMDAFPAPIVRVEGAKIVVLGASSKKTSVHEMLWWTP